MAQNITRTESHHHIAGKVEHELTFKPYHSMGQVNTLQHI